MKSLKYIYVGIATILFAAVGCEDNQVAPADPTNKNSIALSANFIMINASTDGPSLDLYVDNIIYGASVPTGQGQVKYTSVPLTLSAPTINGSAVASSAIRAKATTGTIGGILGSSDLIFRAGNNNANNFTAVSGASYTVIALDSINRPKPVRTLNGTNIGDITYYSSVASFTAKKILDAAADTVIQLNVGSNNSILTANLLKKYNGGALPSFFIPIGIVPLGSTDVGGIRFLLITDELPLPSSTRLPVPTTGKFAVRFVNASPDLGATTPTCKIGATSLTSGTFAYPMTQPSNQGNFNPSVGSKGGSATAPVSVSFKNDFAAFGTYDIVIAVGAKNISLTGQSFVDGGVYTVLLTGSLAKNTLAAALVQNK